jgi:hypothetical protein
MEVVARKQKEMRLKGMDNPQKKKKWGQMDNHPLGKLKDNRMMMMEMETILKKFKNN